MKKYHIPITKPYFDRKEINSLVKVIKSRWVTQGSQVMAFEKKFSKYVGTKYALATSSCTSALHLCLIASGIGKNDEVILPAFTFIATANAVEYVGAKPVFCDISLDTFNIDVSQIEEKITSRTRAIIPVHLFGLVCNMKPILKIARKYNLTVIEDAACAAGSIMDGKMAGSFGKFGCFSFHPRKIMVTGEGGMITFNERSFKKALTALRSHGADFSDLEAYARRIVKMARFNILGYNYRMTDLQAAVGLEQLKKLEASVKRRITLANRYNQALQGIDYLNLPLRPEGYRHSYQTYVVFVRKTCPLSRDRIMLKLSKLGVMVRVGTHAVHLQGYYRRKYGLKPTDFPHAFSAQEQSFALPLYPEMNLKEQSYVIKSFISILS